MNDKDILHFWFEELSPKQWWSKDAAVDQKIKENFSNLHEQATQGKLEPWRKTPEGRLAEIIILDQFSRSLYRNSPQAYANDELALSRAQEAIRVGAHQELEPEMRAFMYRPFMHSESKEIHEIAVKLFSEAGLERNLKFEYLHKKIIDRFGRYPHRNLVLGRTSTPEEIEFLKQPGSSF